MDEQQQQLQNYIYQQLQTGQSPDEISSQLSAAGWPAEALQQAFLAIQAQVVPTHMQATAAHNSQLPQANGKRRGRIKVGLMLLKQSLVVLRGNKYLLRYLLMTWVTVIALNLVSFFIIWFGFRLFNDQYGNSNAAWYIFVFLCYLIIYCAVNFYAAALASNILDIFRGTRQPYGSYIRAARAKFWPIFVYSLFSAVIGMILQYVVERIKWVGWIIAYLLGTAWSLGTMFVLPIIMDSDTPALPAIKQSVKFFKQTWGENVTAKVTVNAPLAIINILLYLAFSALAWAAIAAGSIALFFVIFFVFIFIALNLAVIGSFANSLLNVALYYYAVHHQVPPGFSADMLNQVFITRKRRFFKKIKDQPTA